ncbi:hypothetical protein [Enterococcus faecium]|uniref:hypothetical protein n=1 Tax=Enterococcus faecium TaxID=1352 RepID=UPI0029541A13|nr:hypothetical protein [Enterococcus faecium]MDV7750012.1 hypothetical protein [Enterococcus faecium]
MPKKEYRLPDIYGNMIPVSKTVYEEWYKYRRRERYLQERDVKHGTISLSEMAAYSVYGDAGISDKNSEVEHFGEYPMGY